MELSLTPELIQAYLDGLAETGRSETTLETYRQRLKRLYMWLPEEKKISRRTLEEWGDALVAEGYTVRTVNLSLSAANGLLAFCGRRELCADQRTLPENSSQPELTRQEYLRLLSTARFLGKEREYLMIKLFGSTDLMVRNLYLVTVEAARAGEICVDGETVSIPNYLCGEVLAYARRSGIRSGSLFVTKQGKPLDRTSVTSTIQRLSRDARVPEEKATPRCLRKLYLSTLAEIQAIFARMAEQSFNHLLETEQESIAWDA